MKRFYLFLRVLAVMGLCFGAPLAISACASNGAEEVGEEIDDAADDVGDAVDDAADEVEDWGD